MPKYDLECLDCKYQFTQEKKISEPLNKTCPKCGMERLAQLFSGYEPVTISKLFPKTFGQQSEYNCKQLGKTRLEEMMAPEIERKKAEKPSGAMGVDLNNPEAVKRYIEEGK